MSKRSYYILQAFRSDDFLLETLHQNKQKLDLIRFESLPYKDYEPTKNHIEYYYIVLERSVRSEDIADLLNCRVYPTSVYKQLMKGCVREPILIVPSAENLKAEHSKPKRFYLLIFLFSLILSLRVLCKYFCG